MRLPRRCILPLAITAGLVSTAAANGLELRARVEGTISGEQHLETAGPAASGALFLGHEWAGGTRLDGTNHPIAQSALDDAGRAAVLADAFPSSPGNNDTAAGVDVWTFNVTNTGAQPVSYLYLFELHGPTLEVYNMNSPTAGNSGHAAYGFVVRKNGNPVVHSHANLDARDRHVSPTGTFVLPTTFFSNGPAHTGVHFGDRNDTVPLGTLQPGESMAIEVTVEASAQIGGTGVAARARWGDAEHLSQQPGVTGTVVPDVPVAARPAAWCTVKGWYR